MKEYQHHYHRTSEVIWRSSTLCRLEWIAVKEYQHHYHRNDEVLELFVAALRRLRLKVVQ